MYDAINPTLIDNANPEMVAGYVGGKWPSYVGYTDENGKHIPSIRTLFPNAIHVSIAVFADEDAQVLDVEATDATPEQSVDWAIRQRKRGQIPTIYCNEDNGWSLVREAFHARNVPEPLYWTANYDKGAEIPSGTIGRQYHNTAGYDVSIIADSWPGVDHGPSPHPAPVPAHPTNTYTVRPGDNLSSIAAAHGMDWHALYGLNHAAIGNDPNHIEPGEVLVLSRTAVTPSRVHPIHYVGQGETLSGIASHYGISDWHTLYNLNRSVVGSDPNAIFPGQRLVLP